jgi:predicted enzyme related to lactoylglutathione lyase
MEISKHPPGTFCWIELGTTDQNAAKKFYSELFGWGINDVPMGPDSFYTMFQINGKDVGAAYQLMPDQVSQGIPPNWLSYVAVESADETAKAITATGGKIIKEPFDVFDIGRMAVVEDPTGGVFALWQAGTHIGVLVKNENNTFCWNELATRDVEVAKKFYATVFGWNPQTKGEGPMQYTEISVNDSAGKTQPIGGMMAMTEEWAGIPPHWMVYFDVADCDASAATAQSLGGKVCVPPTDIPNVGRFSVLQDPQSAFFSIIKLNRKS